VEAKIQDFKEKYPNMNVKSLDRQPLHEQLSQALRMEVFKRKAGASLGTEGAWAKKFSVSMVTVREAVLLLINEGLLERRRGKGLVVVDPFASRHIAIATGLDLGQPRISYYFQRVIQDIRMLFDKMDIKTKLYMGYNKLGEYDSDHPEKQIMDDVHADAEKGKVAGVILITAHLNDKQRRDFKKWHIPVIGDGDEEGPNTFQVRHDIPEMVKHGINYLLDRGCRKLALMGHYDKAEGIFREIMNHNRLKVVDEWLKPNLDTGTAVSSFNAFMELWHARTEKPDGLLILDDIIYGDTIVAILAAGVKVPEELKIVTHSNRGAQALYPFPVARMELDPGLVAEEKVKLMLKLLRGEIPDPAIIIPPFKWIDEESNVNSYKKMKQKSK
jgi:DNA-binding LacI/PurR family transcriptional regulator